MGRYTYEEIREQLMRHGLKPTEEKTGGHRIWVATDGVTFSVPEDIGILTDATIDPILQTLNRMYPKPDNGS